MILAHIPSLQGGAWNEYTGMPSFMIIVTISKLIFTIVLKQNRITAIATENNIPLVALVQSVCISKETSRFGNEFRSNIFSGRSFLTLPVSCVL
jgi:hypothetical protein